MLLKRQVKEGVLQVTRIGKESYHYIGEGGIRPHCPAGELPDEIMALADETTAIALLCSEHWLHITFTRLKQEE
jgi:hypothetical protein